MKFNSRKFALALAVSGYFFYAAANPGDFRFIDSVNLIFHEAGHVVFAVLGSHMAVMGGTLMQLAVPLVCVVYFWYRRQKYSASLVLFWAGESLLNVSAYASDAYIKQLPLLGGDGAGHDWANMLGWFGAVGRAEAVGGWIRTAAVVVILAAACGTMWYSREPEISPEGTPGS